MFTRKTHDTLLRGAFCALWFVSFALALEGGLTVCTDATQVEQIHDSKLVIGYLIVFAISAKIHFYLLAKADLP